MVLRLLIAVVSAWMLLPAYSFRRGCLAGKKQLEFPLNTTTTTMTIPSDLSNADIVVIGFGGTAPAKVRIMLPACCFLCLLVVLRFSK
jgi:hypothetical protein